MSGIVNHVSEQKGMVPRKSSDIPEEQFRDLYKKYSELYEVKESWVGTKVEIENQKIEGMFKRFWHSMKLILKVVVEQFTKPKEYAKGQKRVSTARKEADKALNALEEAIGDDWAEMSTKKAWYRLLNQ